MADPSVAKLEEIASLINADGQYVADHAMNRAHGSTDVAIAILGVAVGLVIDRIEPERRAEVLRNYLESFE